MDFQRYPTSTDTKVLDGNGMLIQLWGALIPTGYQLDKTIPNRPWVCPVRTCRKAFAKPNDFGFHFEVRPAKFGNESLVAL